VKREKQVYCDFTTKCGNCGHEGPGRDFVTAFMSGGCAT
jgi:hypothetical protein